MSARSVALDLAHRAGAAVDRSLERPREVLGALIALQILGTLLLGLSVDHNGWVWFQGGDQIWLSTQSWLLGQLELPPTELGYVWSYLLAPIMWVTGPTFVQALPPLVILQVAVLGPIALLCVYDLATRIGGRLLGYWASLLWVAAPFASIPLWVDRYQERWSETFLPQALGLTAMSDFPSMVLVLATAVFVARSLESKPYADAVLAGLLLGAAGALKAPNLLLGVGVVLAYAAARRWRAGIACLAAVIPSLLLLALWKERGLGQIPLLSVEGARLAAGAATAAVSIDVGRYVDLDLDHWRAQMGQLREFFWSARLVQWAPLAGLLAVVRVRRPALAALLGGWLAAFVVVKGFSPRATIESGSFWRLLMPAWPAYLLLLASIPVLVPTLARRLGTRLRQPIPSPVRPGWAALVAAVTVGVPAVAIAASTPLEGPSLAVTQDDEGNFILTSVDDSIRLEVQPVGASRKLTWDDGPWRADVFYRVYRSTGADVECENSDGHPAQSCYLRAEVVATTRNRTYVDDSAPPGATYRIGVGTNWIDDPEAGDVFAFSPPAASG